LIGHGSHRKRQVQQFFYCCIYICCRSKIFTEPLPVNDWGHTQVHSLKGGICEISCWDGLMFCDIYTKIRED
jgi:hypothetical protein